MSAVAAGSGELPVACLCGPTASGKTALALALAARLPLEIVSVDATLVYRGLDIGTAKPTPAERAGVPHHLIDIREPTESYSAGAFLQDVEPLLAAIHARGRLPLLVGGTMLYFRVLQRGLAHLPTADPGLRAALAARAAAEGWPALHAELHRVDPVAAARIAPQDAQRIQRALEVHHLSGRPLSAHWQQQRVPARPILHLALIDPDRARLHRRIEARFTRMLQAGFVEEVRALRQRYPGLSLALPAMRAVGYRQVWARLEGELDDAQLLARGVAATRQLAKRQLTALRAEPALIRLDPLAPDRVRRAECDLRSFFGA